MGVCRPRLGIEVRAVAAKHGRSLIPLSAIQRCAPEAPTPRGTVDGARVGHLAAPVTQVPSRAPAEIAERPGRSETVSRSFRRSGTPGS